MLKDNQKYKNTFKTAIIDLFIYFYLANEVTH